MSYRASAGAFVCAVMSVSLAWAGAPVQGDDDAAAFCAMVRARDRARSVLATWPSLYLSAGSLNSAFIDNSLSDTLNLRLMVGMSYNVAEALKARVQHDYTEALCQHYRAESELRSFVAERSRGLSRRGLEAKLAVIERAIPVAEGHLESVRQRVHLGAATLEDENGFEARLDGLRAALYTTRNALDDLPEPKVTGQLDHMLTAEQSLNAEVKRQLARVDRSAGWNLRVVGGYDRIAGFSGRIPVFAAVNFTLSFGMPMYFTRQDESVTASLHFADLETGGVRRDALQTAHRLQRGVAAAAQRREQIAERRQRMAQRLQAVARAEDAASRHLWINLWFDTVDLDAEDAYLQGYAADLAGLAGASP